MESIREVVSLYSVEIILGMALVIIILLLINIIFGIRVSKIKKRYELLVRGMDKTNIEDILIRHGEEIDDIKGEIAAFEEALRKMDNKLAFAVQKVGFVRYNAFGEMGSELSFSIAFLDDFLNGFVLTSIYGRENSICYAKPIKNGKSIYPLSAEEIQSIDRAIKGDLFTNL